MCTQTQAVGTGDARGSSFRRLAEGGVGGVRVERHVPSPVTSGSHRRSCSHAGHRDGCVLDACCASPVRPGQPVESRALQGLHVAVLNYLKVATRTPQESRQTHPQNSRYTPRCPFFVLWTPCSRVGVCPEPTIRFGEAQAACEPGGGGCGGGPVHPARLHTHRASPAQALLTTLTETC
jgi:hypothetical protein